MIKKFLKEAVAICAGRPAEGIVEFIDDKKYVNEFLIAKKLEITINQVRNILYKLSDCGLVSSIRKKDKRKGWYTYFWKIESVKALEFFKENINKRLYQIGAQVKSRETKTFYVCKNCHIELNDENALLHEFTCSECGDILVIKDNTKLLRELKKNFDRHKRELSLVEEEIVIGKSILEKRRLREISKDKKKAIKKKIAKKKVTKKVVKKKSIKTKSVSKKKIPKKKTKKKIAKKKKKKFYLNG